MNAPRSRWHFLPTVQDLIIQLWHNLWIASLEQIKYLFSPLLLQHHTPFSCPPMIACDFYYVTGFSAAPLLCPCVHTSSVTGKQHQAQSSQRFSSKMQLLYMQLNHTITGLQQSCFVPSNKTTADYIKTVKVLKLAAARSDTHMQENTASLFCHCANG